MKIAVAGATGRVRQHIVDVLEVQGHEVVRSRAPRAWTGHRPRLGAGPGGCRAVMDAASSPSPDQKSATTFFTAATRNLQEAGCQGRREVDPGGLDHRDRPLHRWGYAGYGSRTRRLRAGPVPVRILRAAQFHELVEQLIEWGRKGDVATCAGCARSSSGRAGIAEKIAATLATHPVATGPGSWRSRDLG